MELDVGEYVIMPRTSGCGFYKPSSNKKEPLVQKNGQLSIMAELTLKDIFKRLDLVQITDLLEYDQFQVFMKRGLNEDVTRITFKDEIVTHFCSNGKDALTLRGFL